MMRRRVAAAGRTGHHAALSLLVPLLLLLSTLAVASAAAAAAAPPKGSPDAPIKLGGRRDRRACNQALRAVARQRRRAGKVAEQEARPVVTLSYAQTLDGCIAWAGRHAAEISCPPALALTHSLRAEHDCILVGAGTLQQDNPRLNVRLPARRSWFGLRRQRHRDPRPVLLVSAVTEDEGGGLSWLWGPWGVKELPPLPFDPASLRLARPPIVFTPDLRQLVHRLGGEAAAQALRLDGWDFVECRAEGEMAKAAGEGGKGCDRSKGGKGHRRCDVRDCLRRLRAVFRCRSVMVEGGARVLTACLNAGVVDVACVTVAPAMMAPGAGYRAVQGERQKGWLVRFREWDWDVVRVGRDMVVVAVPD